METKTIIKGHTVCHDASVSAGVRYLIYEIDAQEARAFFNEAYNHGFAVFEDHAGYKYKLIHHGSEYQLVKS